MRELWTYRTPADTDGMQLEGLEVDAVDGHIGAVDEATYEVGESYIVVDTGFWIFGKRRLIPASAIDTFDLDAGRITLRLTKDEVKEAPDYDEVRLEQDQSYRDTLAGYYGGLGPY